MATSLFRPDLPSRGRPSDRILVVGGGHATLDLLRFATICSDDIVYVSESVDPAVLRFARRFAIEIRERGFVSDDLADAQAVLLCTGSDDGENAVVRAARRRGVGIHVAGRPLVSDFTLLEWLEHPESDLAA